MAALQINLIFANWIKYMPAGPGSADATTPAVSSAILALGLAYLLSAFARWAPLLGSTNAKLSVRKARPRARARCGLHCRRVALVVSPRWPSRWLPQCAGCHGLAATGRQRLGAMLRVHALLKGKAC